MKDIEFSFEEKDYTVNAGAYDTNRIVLPDKRVLAVDMWLESLPPMPNKLTVSSEAPTESDFVATEVTK